MKIDGVYDKETIKLLGRHGVHDFSFDFRPKSFNFIQAYQVESILSHGFDISVFLQFAGEKDFVIQKILQDLDQRLQADRTYLEFSDGAGPAFYDTFQRPYFVHLDDYRKVTKDFLSGEYLVGVIFHYQLLSDALNAGSLPELAALYYKALGPRSSSVKTFLKRGWESDVFVSIDEFFSFEAICLPIDSCVETQFRCVDVGRVEQAIRFLNK